jgi:hypothetical protein
LLNKISLKLILASNLVSFTVETMLMIRTVLFVGLLHIRLAFLLQLFLVQILLLFRRKNGGTDSEEAVEEDFGAADQTEPHAETEQTS